MPHCPLPRNPGWPGFRTIRAGRARLTVPPCLASQGALHPASARARRVPLKGTPNVEDLPVIEGTPVPVVEHGTVLPDVEGGANVLRVGFTTSGVSVMRGAAGFGARATDGGLRPPTPISVEPNGIPTGPTDDDDPIPVGDEADAVPPDGVLALPAQAPEPLPDMPPPSNIVVEPELPAVDIPVSKEFPGIEVPMPAVACGSEPPAPEQVAMPPNGDMPDVIGLTPGDASSVAPIGIPVCATGEPGPMPSGDVMPSGASGEMLIPPTCA
jgi:hypothetical protein